MKQSVAKAKASGLYEGWMKKQGGFVKTFNKRYCVLNPKILYYYKEENVSPSILPSFFFSVLLFFQLSSQNRID